ncbi:IS701 family transposase [Streptomyces sp. NPDC059009]|uniref:IS701 family transposase n=1 Tax=Streptomyces sp. NPDC059009 TaxID=3346694 RepID=UPI00367652A2
MSVQSGAVLVRDVLSSYAGEVFRPMPRVDQRRWAEVYLRGLLAVEGKKTVRRIAEDVLSLPAHQSLQQFINQSPWGWGPVRRELVSYLNRRDEVQAWVLARTAIPKRGDRSVGVGRHFLPEEGRLVNSQIGLAVVQATRHAGVPVNWRLLLSRQWLADAERREAAYIPEGVNANPQSTDFLEMLDELAGPWQGPTAPVVADLRSLPDADRLICGLGERGLGFALEVDGSLQVSGGAPISANSPSRPHFGGPLGRAMSALEYVFLRLHRRRAGADGAPRHPKIISSAVRLPAHDAWADGTTGAEARPFREVRLLSELSPTGVPTRFWVTSLADQGVESVMTRARLVKRTQDELQALESLGLRDFEGRSFRGWHHHMTMVSAASAFDRFGWEPESSAP